MDKIIGSDIIIERDLRKAIAALVSEKNTFTLTDENVLKLYPQLFKNSLALKAIKAGEDSKRLSVLEDVLRAMVKAGLDRGGKLIAVGGGVVGDLGGFAAAVYMRGINWINVPTTFLAQADSSIGGKTAVDLDDLKNMIGAFHLPKQILISTDFLKTLPPREMLCGAGEALKSAFIDRRLYDYIMKERPDLTDANKVHDVVKMCALFKDGITRKDFTESGLRKILNVGHTVGHALEYADKHRKSHGEYVLVGMAVESGIFKADIDKQFYKEMQSAIFSLINPEDFDIAAVAKAAMSDKKNKDGLISVMVPINPETVAEKFLTQSQLIEGYAKWKSEL